MDAVFHRLWRVEICGFLLLTTTDVLISRYQSSGGSAPVEVELNNQRNATVTGQYHLNSSSFTGSRFTCNMNTSCFSMWIVEPRCLDGFLDLTRSGYINISLGVLHCPTEGMEHNNYTVYWFWGSQLDYLKEISRCRHFSVCRIRALTVEYSPSSRHWLNILVNSSTSSFIGSISIAADFRHLKKDLSLINATQIASVHTVMRNPKVVHRNRHSISLQTEETENMPNQRVEMDTSRQKRDVNEAEDLAVLMKGENPESKAKIVELISTDFASGGFSDPVVSHENNAWSDRLGPRMGVMVRNLYSDLNAQSVNTANDKLDMISLAMIELRQKTKYAEREIADSDHQLNVANKMHADIAAKGRDTSESQWRKSRQEDRLNYWIQAWKNMKNRYESALRGETGIGADVDQGKRITVSDEDVSEGGAVTYDEKPEVERHNCTFFYNNRYPTLEDGLVNCSWYATKACCKRTEVASVFSAMDPLYKATKLCRNYINFLMCFFCSPDQYKFYTLKNRKAEVCSNYCESLYEECKTAGFKKTLIGEAYANGTAFCAAQNFLVSENADCFKFDPKVFGHSHRVCPMTLQLLVLVVCVCLRLCPVSVTFHA